MQRPDDLRSWWHGDLIRTEQVIVNLIAPTRYQAVETSANPRNSPEIRPQGAQVAVPGCAGTTAQVCRQYRADFRARSFTPKSMKNRAWRLGLPLRPDHGICPGWQADWAESPRHPGAPSSFNFTDLQTRSWKQIGAKPDGTSMAKLQSYPFIDDGRDIRQVVAPNPCHGRTFQRRLLR